MKPDPMPFVLVPDDRRRRPPPFDRSRIWPFVEIALVVIFTIAVGVIASSGCR